VLPQYHRSITVNTAFAAIPSKQGISILDKTFDQLITSA